MDITLDASVQRVKEGKNIGFLFDDEDRFNGIGYKVTQAPDKGCFLKGAKIKYNGQLKLIYFVEDYQSLPTILSTLQSNAASALLCKLLATILQIPQYGFLIYENLLVSPEDIYFDPKTLEPKLVYLPLKAESTVEGKLSFENQLRRNLCNAIKNGNQMVMTKLVDVLTDTSGGLEELLRNLQGMCGNNVINRGNVVANQHVAKPRGVILVCSHPSYPLHYEITREKFTFGRGKDNDGVLGFSNMISRIHFSIVNDNGVFYVIDEKSTKGTYLNGKVCQAYVNVPLHEGDVIRIWELSFVVKFIY